MSSPLVLRNPLERCSLVVAAAFFGALASARAGDYHDAGTLDCAECHVMHLRPSSRASSLAPPVAPADEVGPLLKHDVNELCLSCHDDSLRATDVLGRNNGRRPSDLRQAGFLGRIGSGDAATGHTLGALDTAPGSDPPWRAEDENGSGVGLNCINCHAPHGRQGATSAYRNLRTDAGNNAPGEGLVTYNDAHPGTNDSSRDVFVRRALSYDESAVDFNEPDARDSAMARFCAGCHDRFHGLPGVDQNIGGFASAGGLSGFVRHPASGVNIGAIGGEWSSAALFAAHDNRVKTLSASGSWSGAASDLTPTCISCHKAHGNGNPFGLIFRSGRGAPTEDGDSGGRALEDLCGQCHATRPAFGGELSR